MNSLKRKVYEIVCVSTRKGDASWFFDMFIVVLILLNTAALIVESFADISTRYAREFFLFEAFSVAVFTVEYLMRLWTSTLNPRYASPFTGRLRYALTPLAMIDLLAIAPFYLPFVGVDLRIVRVLRVLRLFRLFKVARYIQALSTIRHVLHKKREELYLSLTFTFLILLITSSLMYFVENEAQPQAFASIPDTMWWGIATLTTVGYGDVYPVTPLGRFLGGMIAIIGIGLFALPTSILASGFADAISSDNKKRTTVCPHCGKEHIVE